MLTASLIVLTLLGFACAVMLTVASKFFYVQEDPKIAAVAGALPGANCGGCGFAGCEGYAASVVHNPATPPNLCCVGGSDTAAKVGDLTGKAAGASEPMRAFRRCQKVEGRVQPRFRYEGMDTCAAADRLNNGTEECDYACMGFGDCFRACQFNALVMRDGMPLVLTLNCTSCGACVKACPRGIMQLIPQRARVMVHCSTLDKAKAVTDVCGVGCIKCLRCVKACPAGAVSLAADQIQIDHTKCLAYGPACKEACVTSCPRKILRRMCLPEGFVEEAPEEKAQAAAPKAVAAPPPVQPGGQA